MPRYRIVADESTVDIDLNVNLHPSHVRARKISGTIECEFDRNGLPRLDAPYAARLTLPVASLKSGIGLQDREMRRRFDVKRYPGITATLMSAKALARRGSYRATFEISMHGQTREVAGSAKLKVVGGTLTIDGEQKINMQDFGIEPPRLLILKVEPVVTVHAHIVAQERR